MAVVFRIALAYVNDGKANDDHLRVSLTILNDGKIPIAEDCWQCYHPKLYHFTVAQLWSFLRLKTERGRYISAQLLNAVAGVITILILWVFLRGRPVSDRVKLLLFGMIALNPRLIGINAQATNDSFVILFSTAALFFLYRYICTLSIKNYLLLLTFAILAGLTKGNALVIIVGIAVVFVVKIIATHNFQLNLTKGYAGGAIVFLLTTAPIVGFFGQYYGNYIRKGDPIALNAKMGQELYLFRETSFRRPGVKSIASAYFTFRLLDMIRKPKINNSKNSYPTHRTSVWSQLYGRTHFIYFDDWPKGIWQSDDFMMMQVGRATLILALFPSLAFLVGIIRGCRTWLFALRKRSLEFLSSSNEWIFHVFVAGYLVFIVVFTALYRDFCSMKIIYLFPGLLAALALFAEGLEEVYCFLPRRRIVAGFLDAVMVMLPILYLIPIVNLIQKGLDQM